MVPLLNLTQTRKDLPSLNCSDSTPCNVIIRNGIEPWHLCRLSSDESHARFDATLSYTFDDSEGDLLIEFPRRIIIKKEKRLSPLDNKIVDTHGDKINSNCVMNP